MKSKYTFQIKGRLKLPNAFPIKSDGFTFNFVTDRLGIVSSLEVECQCQSEDWPKLSKNAYGKTEVDVRSSAWPFIVIKLRGIESLCSIWGIKSIIVDNYRIEWIPDSEEEKSNLKIYNYEVSSLPLSDEELKPVKFPFVGQAVIASWDGEKISTICSFFRRGSEDYENRQYITAIYQFYFILESLYGDGKFKEKDLVRKFAASKELKLIFDKTYNNDEFMFGISRELISKFNESEYYGDRNFDKFMLRFIKLRGFLHHHSSKNTNAWHPERHIDYELDAFALSALANSVAINKIWDYCGTERVVAEYNRQLIERNV